MKRCRGRFSATRFLPELLALALLSLIGVLDMPAAEAANGQCRWEGGSGAAGGYAYCEAEDCTGDGGNALCSAGDGVLSSGYADSELGPDKWVYRACEEVAGSIPRDAMWCRAAGGTWQGSTLSCKDLPAGFLGESGYNANGDAPLTAAAYAYANRGGCGATVTSDTGWNSTVSSQWCNGGSPTFKLGALIRDFRRQTFSCGASPITYTRGRDANCPAGYKLRNSVRGQECYMPQACCTVGNPVSPVTGAKFEQELDYRGPGSGELEFRRYYNSSGYFRPRVVTTPQDSTEELLPKDFWRHSYERRFFPVTGSAHVSAMVQVPDGSVMSFDTAGNQIGNVSGGAAKLQFAAGSGWTLTLDNHDVERYSLAGQLISITTRAGLVTSITYSGDLVTVSDPFGHSIVLSHDPDGLLTLVTLPDGSEISYTYDEYKRLTTVTYPDGKNRVYSYSDVRNWWLLTGIQDENGQAYGAYSYDAQGRAVSSSHAGGAGNHSFTYNANGTTTVTDPAGASTVWGFSASGGAMKTASYSQPCFNCGNVSSRTFDGHGNLSAQTDFNGNQTLFIYDPVRNLETWRNEAAGTPQSSVITTEWHPTFRLPTQVARPGQRLNFTYDTNGSLLTRAVTDTVANTTRTWTYTYNAYGQVIEEDGPRTDVSDVTSYTYNNCTAGYGCGQLATATDAAGNVTSYLTYDAHGNPLTISDPNGVVTTYTYDERQRLASSAVGSETTAYEYWPTGLVKKVTQPDGSFVSNSYDAAHRLTSVADHEGNRVEYTLDSAGNHTKEDVYDATNVLARTRSFEYDSAGRLHREIGAGNQARTYEYDDAGNLIESRDPMGRVTNHFYDALNRAAESIDPVGGVTQYAYDARNNLVVVTDPRQLQTSYTFNGFDDTVALSSPDSGATSYARDAAGSLAATEDARGREAEYSYDALGRVTRVEYSDQTIAFTYDTGANGRGRRVGMSDQSGSTQWHYDAQGRVTTKNVTMGSLAKSVVYSYDGYGRLSGMQTPSGLLVAYLYLNGRVSGINVNGTVLISNILYSPFGPTLGWQWGNGTLTAREYDTDGQLVSIDSAGLSTYTYNADGTIASRSDSDPAPDISGASSLVIDISSTSNRIVSTTATASNVTRTYTYDAMGNTTSDGLHTFVYNDAGRLTEVHDGGLAAQYRYNGAGQRVRKWAPSGVTYFVYDEAGHLLGQYAADGSLIEEIIWFGDIPIATARTGSGGGVGFFYIHTDHLNTPVRLTRTSDNAIMWRWDHDPYGVGAPDEDAEGNGAFVFFNARFPGQYYDPESGLHYNYYRDGYAPYVGRYTQSDPIGLGGGVNTYAYANGNPIARADPTGQFAAPPVLSPPGAAAAVAWYAGYTIGSFIYNGIAVSLQDALQVPYDPNAPTKPECPPPCPECSPYKKGTVGYLGPHADDHFSKVHGRNLNPHLNLFVVQQNPKTCKCFWRKNKPDAVEPPAVQGWVDLNKGFPPLVP